MDFLKVPFDFVLNLKPSQYEYLLPMHDRAKLDELSSTGEFPAMRDLSSSFLVAAILGISRLFLTHALIKVSILPFYLIEHYLAYNINYVNKMLFS